jgi:homogentisate 1,2-dioxygenase
MAFMFESCYMVGLTDWGLKTCQKLQEGYSEESWAGLKDQFRPPPAKGKEIQQPVAMENGH